MNLAEIRKKAQKGESPVQEVAVPAPVVALVPEAPALEPPAPQAAPEPATEELPAAPADFEWGSESEADLVPAWYHREELERFDPAAVILKGRESSSFGEEAVVKEELKDAATLELLCFKVGAEEYAISIMEIKEIIKPREVTEVPRVPSFVRGILSLRGIIIPIFDMRERLGLPGAERTERERVVVVNRQSGFCGILVDEVVQVVRVPEAGVEPPPVVLEGIDRDFVQGIGRVAGRMLILLDIEKVLDVSLTS